MTGSPTAENEGDAKQIGKHQPSVEWQWSVKSCTEARDGRADEKSKQCKTDDYAHCVAVRVKLKEQEQRPATEGQNAQKEATGCHE
jgi:hypothetical protein